MNRLYRPFSWKHFYTVLQRDFNLCFFVSLIILALSSKSQHVFQNSPYSRWLVYLALPAINGFFTTILALLLNHAFRRKNYTKKFYSPDIQALSIVSFTAGCLSAYITVSELATYIISLLIIYIAYLNVREFARNLSALLRPNTMATIGDVGMFVNFFINLMISFAVINLSLNALHIRLNSEQAFNFGSGIGAIIDSIYFSIITMTTVGYGDIFPHTALSRLITGVECLTSYLMLGIMIGIISRGITFNK